MSIIYTITEYLLPVDHELAKTSSPVFLELLQSEPHAGQYRLVKPWPYCRPLSLIHTYHQFKSRGIDHYFFIVPSIGVHIDCDPSNFTRSLRGLPYPKLDVFIQSCLDTYDMVRLRDVIDGTNGSEEWGEMNLGLEGTNDVEWAKEKKKQTGNVAVFSANQEG